MDNRRWAVEQVIASYRDGQRPAPSIETIIMEAKKLLNFVEGHE